MNIPAWVVRMLFEIAWIVAKALIGSGKYETPIRGDDSRYGRIRGRVRSARDRTGSARYGNSGPVGAGGDGVALCRHDPLSGGVENQAIGAVGGDSGPGSDGGGVEYFGHGYDHLDAMERDGLSRGAVLQIADNIFRGNPGSIEANTGDGWHRMDEDTGDGTSWASPSARCRVNPAAMALYRIRWE